MQVLQHLLNIIAPTYCLGCGVEGSSLCTACTSVKLNPYGSRCYVCARLNPNSQTCSKCSRLGGPRHVWISCVYDELVGQLIEAYKYDCNRQVAANLSTIMTNNFALNKKLDYMLVSLPAAPTRRRERGFDHALLLAKLIASKYGLTYSSALGRHGDLRQVGSSRTQRFKQAKASYFTAKPKTVAGRNVLLIDDVVTTGATLQAAAKALRAAGAKQIDALVFAKRV